MYAKVFSVIMLFLFLLCGCVCTTRVDEQILEYQREIDYLETAIRDRDRTIDTAARRLETITDRSRAMETTIDEVIELFDDYQRTVEQLLQDYRATENRDTASDVL